VTRHPTEPHTYVWMERHRDEEALKVHSETSYIAEAMSKVPEWWATRPELLKLTQMVPK
jgi:quinol monooxygenase YgiN